MGHSDAYIDTIDYVYKRGRPYIGQTEMCGHNIQWDVTIEEKIGIIERDDHKI